MNKIFFCWIGWDCTLLTDENDPDDTNRENCLKAFDDLVKDAKRGDCFFFFYSGHGYQLKDKDGHESDGKDECMCCSSYSGKLQFLTDDDIHDRLICALPEGAKLTLVFDCCHSGTIADLSYQFNTETNEFQEVTNPTYVAADVSFLAFPQHFHVKIYQ